MAEAKGAADTTIITTLTMIITTKAKSGRIARL
jgi:hypothetical protein